MSGSEPGGKGIHHRDPADALQRAAEWAGTTLDAQQLRSLVAYADWLIEEAIPAGGLGPDEAERIFDRHVADSLVFGAGWNQSPATLIDVGSGVGLPGIPLAIAAPEISVTLLDRSQRRTDLARRAIRILALEGVSVVTGDADNHYERYTAAVFRASYPPDRALAAAGRLLEPNGVAVIGLRRGQEPPSIPEATPDTEIEILKTDEGVLDSPAWHLRMTVR